MAVAGLIFGILSLVGGSIPIVNAFPMWLLGVVGIILSTVARKRERSGVATAGLVISIIGTVLALSLWVACLVCAGVAGAAGMLGL